jgi:hypothetical protein
MGNGRAVLDHADGGVMTGNPDPASSGRPPRRAGRFRRVSRAALIVIAIVLAAFVLGLIVGGITGKL